MPPPDESANAQPGPLSLERLKAAFAQMLSPGGQKQDEPAEPAAGGERAIGVHAVVEGILFVGAEDGQPRTAKQLAESLRNVTPDEVDQAVQELNQLYEQDAAPYRITASPSGYQLTLDDDLARLRDKFYGRVKEATLSPAALEVLSVVAYRQPMTAAEIDRLRGARSGTLLSGLVRRGLVRVDRPTEPDDDKATKYHTTDRFLKLFGLGDLEQLPRAAELE